MRRYIYEAVEKMKNKKIFSMPGHKSKNIFDFDFKNDITETIGTDNLLNPRGCILKSQKELARVYEVERSYYIPNGSTAGLYIAISALTNPKDEVLIQRNSHKAVYNALVLNDLIPNYINPNYDKENNLLTGIDLLDLEDKLRKNPSIKLVVLTSPNYFGICLKLKKIAQIVHTYGAYLVVDEAHGSHLKFSDLKEYSAVNSKADIIVHSSHKTLASLTQAAIIHINNSSISHERILTFMNLYLSTSPSYLLMQSSEFGVNYLEKYGQNLLERNKKYIENFKNDLKDRVIFYKPNPKDTTIGAVDYTKLLLRLKGYTGFEIVKNLFLRYNIRLEMGDLYYALALTSLMDEEEDFLELKDALLDLPIKKAHIENTSSIEIPNPQIKILPRQAFYARKEFVDLEKASGRISGSIVAAYPPGSPIIAPGELISEDIVKKIKIYLVSGIEVIGINNNKLEVVI